MKNDKCFLCLEENNQTGLSWLEGYGTSYKDMTFKNVCLSLPVKSLLRMRNAWNLEWDRVKADHALSHDVQTRRTWRLAKNSCGFRSRSDCTLQTPKHTLSCRGLIPDVRLKKKLNKRPNGMHFLWDNIRTLVGSQKCTTSSAVTSSLIKTKPEHSLHGMMYYLKGNVESLNPRE